MMSPPHERGKTLGLSSPRIWLKLKRAGAVAAALKSPDIKEALLKLKVDLVETTTPADVVREHTELAKTYSTAAKEIGLQPQ